VAPAPPGRTATKDFPMTRFLAALSGALCAAALAASPASAQSELKLFDAHMHYNWEPKPFYSLAQVLDTFRRNGVAGVLATSRPNDGTRAIVDAKAPGLWVVPFIRPYRVAADVQSWFGDPAIYALIETEYRRGYYRGIGEFHIYGKAAAGEWVKKTVNFAVEHDLYLHAHCDEEALLTLFSHNPGAKIIWAHTGFSTPPARIAELFARYPALWAELSYHSGIVDGSGKLTAAYRDLFGRYSERFLVGSDTWIDPRWAEYDALMRGYRAWLAELPPEQARNIAHANAERMFGGKVE
jgi:amidohydrolase family protein